VKAEKKSKPLRKSKKEPEKPAIVSESEKDSDSEIEQKKVLVFHLLLLL
jgi:hypothetical protein